MPLTFTLLSIVKSKKVPDDQICSHLQPLLCVKLQPKCGGLDKAVEIRRVMGWELNTICSTPRARILVSFYWFPLHMSGVPPRRLSRPIILKFAHRKVKWWSCPSPHLGC